MSDTWVHVAIIWTLKASAAWSPITQSIFFGPAFLHTCSLPGQMQHDCISQTSAISIAHWVTFSQIHAVGSPGLLAVNRILLHLSDSRKSSHKPHGLFPLKTLNTVQRGLRSPQDVPCSTWIRVSVTYMYLADPGVHNSLGECFSAWNSCRGSSV